MKLPAGGGELLTYALLACVFHPKVAGPFFTQLPAGGGELLLSLSNVSYFHPKVASP